jgi:hypothetical protein
MVADYFVILTHARESYITRARITEAEAKIYHSIILSSPFLAKNLAKSPEKP